LTTKPIYLCLANLFVFEWAKFRYGVFEEHGFPGDERFPIFNLRNGSGSNYELVANVCTDQRLNGHRLQALTYESES
jgi:hypothetical protein